MNIENLANEILGSVDRKKVVKPRIKYHRAGKGRKNCPKCDAYVGVRTLICECGHEFVKGETKAVPSAAEKNSKFEEDISDENCRYALAVGLLHGCRLVYAGSGPCPAHLATSDPEDFRSIKQFCEDIVSAGIPDKKLYMPSAIKNWLATLVERSENSQLFDLVDDWYTEKVESTMGLEV